MATESNLKKKKKNKNTRGSLQLTAKNKQSDKSAGNTREHVAAGFSFASDWL